MTGWATLPKNRVLKGVPLPPRTAGPGRNYKKYDFSDMEVGDCLIVDNAMIAQRAQVWAASQGLPRKWAVRSLGNGRHGLWRMA